MPNIFNVSKNQTMFAASDLGWIVGHSFTLYGPLLRGAATILYEGKPIGTPDAGMYWNLVEKHKARALFTFPTAVRAIKKIDPEGEFVKKYDTSFLKTFSFAGERCDVLTYNWIKEYFPNASVNDNYWQTESGWPICSNFASRFK